MGKCERGECNTPSACLAHDECLARDRKENVADVVREMAAIPFHSEVFGETVQDFAARIEAAHAREVEALRSDLSDYMAAANAEAALADKRSNENAALSAEVKRLSAANISYSSQCANLSGQHLAAERRAEAAEGACADAAVVIRHAQLHECGRWPGLLKALDKCAAKSAAISAERAGTRSGRDG